MNASLSENATAIISTFRINGPIQCAGLDIIQYDHDKMLAELPKGFKLIKSEDFTHVTPKQTQQEYVYFILQREA